jgi:hypothetical protein
MNTVSKFKSFITTLGLAMAPEDLLQKRVEWIESLNEAEILELLKWIENSDNDDLLKSLSKPYRLSVLQEAIIIAATAGKRLNSDKILTYLESIYQNPNLKELVIEGIEIYGNPKSLPFLESLLSTEKDQEIIIEIASALYYIGNEKALQLLLGIKDRVKFIKPHYQSSLQEMINEIKRT